MFESIVLSDELLKEYYAFKNNEAFDTLTIKNLLIRYKPHLTNVKQLNEVGIIDSPLSQSLAQNGFTNQTLEELSELTKYKIILDRKKTEYPYVNIFDDKIENNYTSTHYKNASREKARKHISALLKNANYIFVYDKYMIESTSWNHSKKLFVELLPRKSLTICYPKEYREDHLKDKEKEIKAICTNWIIKKDTSNTNHRDLHDRYIVIDKKLEIILTSGIDNLFDETSDFTYIVRDIK